MIIAQAANRASALKATLGRIQNSKAKRLEQLKIIAAIKNNNLQMKATIAKKQAELDCIYPQSIKKTIPNQETLICFLRDPAQKTQELVDIEDKQAYIMMIIEE